MAHKGFSTVTNNLREVPAGKSYQLEPCRGHLYSSHFRFRFDFLLLLTANTSMKGALPSAGKN